jgi:FkbM family methyltransferase
MKSYSQVQQDLWVLKTLENKHGGYFLDVGAYDGIHFSNSYLLEQEYGWVGTLIEANPVNFSAMLKNRPDTNNLMYAITDNCGSISISNNGMSSQIKNNIQNNISSITFRELFNRYNNIPQVIDYLSLDIEGYESQALSQFPFDSYICKTITVEHNLYLSGPSNKNMIKQILLNNNYILVKENIEDHNNPFEDWYIHKSIS